MPECYSSLAKLPSIGVPFSQLPLENQIFLDYLQKKIAINEFYPSRVNSHVELASRIPAVLKDYSTNRHELADALHSMNERWQAGDKTKANIKRLREQDAVVILTEARPGLLTGPLATIYQALSVVKTAACLNARGRNAVPVFWIAGEEYDVGEVATVSRIDRTGKIVDLNISVDDRAKKMPIGKMMLDESINLALQKIFGSSPKNEFAENLQSVLRETYQPGFTLSEAFARLMLRLFDQFGLVLIDPLDERLKKMSAPIYQTAIEKSIEIGATLVIRNQELTDAGYQPQVLVNENLLPLFWIDDEGKRQNLKFGSEQIQGASQSNTKIKSSSGAEFQISELIELTRTAPERLSPTEALRPVVQDFVLPTLCRFGGAAEIANFAQSASVYRILNRFVTPIMPCVSATIVDSKTNRTLEKYDLRLNDFFGGEKVLHAKLTEQKNHSETAQMLKRTEEIINTQLDRLDQSLSDVDAKLSENLARRRGKILWHIEVLQKKFRAAETLKREIAERQLESAKNWLCPRGKLQEQTLNVTFLLARYGENLIEWLYHTIEIDADQHEIIFV